MPERPPQGDAKPTDIHQYQLDKAAEAQSEAELVYEMLDVLIDDLKRSYEIEMSKPVGARDMHHLAELAKQLEEKFLQQEELERAYDANDQKINQILDSRDSFEGK